MHNLENASGQLAHLFPEWALSWSLRLASERDPKAFWDLATYRPAGEAAPPEQLSRHITQPSPPALLYERALTRDEAARFGIDEEVYRRTFWSLRPDFVVEADEGSTFLILEAKGGQLSDAVWRNPKELLYHRFLQACTTFKTKGLFYIVPGEAAEKCANCLRSQFPEDSSIAMGVLTWEGLLPMIYERLVETALDQVIREMEGLKCLRAWHSLETTR